MYKYKYKGTWTVIIISTYMNIWASVVNINVGRPTWQNKCYHVHYSDAISIFTNAFDCSCFLINALDLFTHGAHNLFFRCGLPLYIQPYMYARISVYKNPYIYIYIYIQRDRERWGERERQKKRKTYLYFDDVHRDVHHDVSWRSSAAPYQAGAAGRHCALLWDGSPVWEVFR